MTLSAFTVFNGLAPEGGPKAVAYRLDLTTAISMDLDMVKEQDADQINFFQTIIIDNTLSTKQLNVLVQGVPYNFKVPVGAMGIFPIIGTGHPKFTFSVPTFAAAIIPITLLNVPMAHMVWAP